MLRNILKSSISSTRRVFMKSYSTAPLDIEKLETDATDSEVTNLETKDEVDLERKRNKSRLSPGHYNILHGRPPYSESKAPFHDTIKHKRKLYGRYGAASGVDPQMCWPTPKELQDVIEYDRIAYPKTIPEMIDIAKRQRAEKEAAILKRDQEVAERMAKLEGWIKDLNSKMAKKESEARAAKEKKERLIEEVRRHFGYTVDPRDERFKELLEKKEKEQKKAAKEAKKKAKEELMVLKILGKKGEQKTGDRQKGNAENVEK